MEVATAGDIFVVSATRPYCASRNAQAGVRVTADTGKDIPDHSLLVSPDEGWGGLEPLCCGLSSHLEYSAQHAMTDGSRSLLNDSSNGKD